MRTISVIFASLATVLAQASFAQDVQKQSVNEELRARLPEEIRSAGKITAVNNGSFPPMRSSRAPNCRGRPKIFPTPSAS